jgi:hypothetical protein
MRTVQRLALLVALSLAVPGVAQAQERTSPFSLYLAVGVIPNVFSLDANLQYRPFPRIPLSAMVSLGPAVLPFPLKVQSGTALHTGMRLDFKTGLYLGESFTFGQDFVFTPSLEGVYRGSWQYQRVENSRQGVDRDVQLYAWWFQALAALRLEWRFGRAMGVRFLDPLGVEALVQAPLADPFIVADQLYYGVNLRWTFL